MNSFLTIKPATLRGVGIYRNKITGAEFCVWKIKDMIGRVAFEDSDGRRFTTISSLLKNKLL
jgi:hypothetical protein